MFVAQPNFWLSTTKLLHTANSNVKYKTQNFAKTTHEESTQQTYSKPKKFSVIKKS